MKTLSGSALGLAVQLVALAAAFTGAILGDGQAWAELMIFVGAWVLALIGGVALGRKIEREE